MSWSVARFHVADCLSVDNVVASRTWVEIALRSFFALDCHACFGFLEIGLLGTVFARARRGSSNDHAVS